MKIPHRHSLLLQTTDILRKAVNDGTWNGYLPGERELSRRLHVSRPTLRTALEILQREKVIQTTPGKRRKILKNLKRAARPNSISVVLVSQSPIYSMSRNRLFLFDHLHHTLQENDIRFDVVSNPAYGGDRPLVALKQFEDQTTPRVYILALTSQEVQKWFSNKGLSCMIIGSPFPDVNIPSIECDYPAIGRHAAGTLLGRGHKNLAFIMPTLNLSGDVETERVFQQEVIRAGNFAKSQTVYYGDDSRDFVLKWNKLQKSSEPPTAAFTIYPKAATMLLTHLLSQGIRVPEDFSILCRDTDPLLAWVKPSIAHYVMPLPHFAAKFSSLVLEMATVGTLPLRTTTIMPELKIGESLGSLA